MAVDFDWLTGFIEAERSTMRGTENNNGSGWLDSLELDRPFLEAIERRLHIPTQLIERPRPYRLKTVYSRAVLGIS